MDSGGMPVHWRPTCPKCHGEVYTLSCRCAENQRDEAIEVLTEIASVLAWKGEWLPLKPELRSKVMNIIGPSRWLKDDDQVGQGQDEADPEGCVE